MTSNQFINRGISNYENSIRSTMTNPVQTSTVKTPKFDMHDRMYYGDSRDRLYISRMRELNIKRNKQEIAPSSYTAYVKNLKDEPDVVDGDVVDGDVVVDERVDDVVNAQPPQVQHTDEKAIMELVYPVGTIYSRNIDELPFDFGKWEKIEHECEEEEHVTHQWVRIF